MEELLNKLIDKGWKPRGEEKIHSCRYYKEEKKFKADYTIAGIPQVLYRSIRELVGRESGLWQFVCENKLAISYKGRPLKKKHPEWHKFEDSNGEEVPFSSTCDFLTKYRLIESALCDEDKLEQFLLDNIKIECLKEN